MRHHRRVLRLLVVLGIAILVIGSVSVLSRQERPPRDVFLIVLDTVRLDALGCYAKPSCGTPNLDSLAADGLRFDRAVSSCGWTLPSVATMLTSCWPTVHGAQGRGLSLTRIRDDIPTGPEILARNGFRTVAFTNCAFLSPAVGVARGFCRFDGRSTFNLGTRRAAETVDAVLAELRRNTTGRGFYFVHLFDAHLVYDPPPDVLERFVPPGVRPRPPLNEAMCRNLLFGGNPAGRQYVRDVYQAQVSYLDGEIGRLVSGLKAAGRYDEATIVVAADHGEEFLDHGGFEHGHTLYDELIRVPLILKLPRSLGLGGTVIESQVRTLDVMPTIFDAMGLDVPPSFEGRSLLPVVRGQETAARLAIAEGTLYGPARLAASDGRYKVIRTLRPGFPDVIELYDIRRDPGELRNVARKLPEFTRALLDKLEAHVSREARFIENLSLPRSVSLSPASVLSLRSLGYIR